MAWATLNMAVGPFWDYPQGMLPPGISPCNLVRDDLDDEELAVLERQFPGLTARVEPHPPWMGSGGLASSPRCHWPGGCPWCRRNAAAKAFGEA